MPLQLALLVLIDAGSLVTWRFKAAGATLTTVGAVLLGALAAMEHQPLQGLAVAIAFMVPGVLYWLDWQREQSVRAVTLLAVGFVMLLIVGGIAAFAIHGSLPGSSQFQMLWSNRFLR
ncbi:MAG TPA: hypothetical protein VFV93_15360 [Thermomicrobiales bacterium]|nr:hypothetical protein [Thermomicrobiales bacterium]